MDILQTSPCNLCPRLCGAKRDSGQVGYCGADNRLLAARSALHFWEEPPISGQTGSGTIFFTHCSLHCVYCQNADISQRAIGWEIDINQLAEMCLELQDQGALNINFVTPTHYSLDVCEAVKKARERGLHLPIVWNTSGYERPETLYSLADTVDVFLTDFKYGKGTEAYRYSKAPDYFDVASQALEVMFELTGVPVYGTYKDQMRLEKGVVVRHLLLPGLLSSSKEVLKSIFNRFGNQVLYSIMNQYTPLLDRQRILKFPELLQKPSLLEYEDLLDFADSLGIEDYFWQEGEAAKESFIPVWNGEGLHLLS